jgi:hypothetical protein
MEQQQQRPPGFLGGVKLQVPAQAVQGHQPACLAVRPVSGQQPLGGFGIAGQVSIAVDSHK